MHVIIWRQLDRNIACIIGDAETDVERPIGRLHAIDRNHYAVAGGHGSAATDWGTGVRGRSGRCDRGACRTTGTGLRRSRWCWTVVAIIDQKEKEKPCR